MSEQNSLAWELLPPHRSACTVTLRPSVVEIVKATFAKSVYPCTIHRALKGLDGCTPVVHASPICVGARTEQGLRESWIRTLRVSQIENSLSPSTEEIFSAVTP